MSTKAYKLAKLLSSNNLVSNDKIDTTTIDNLNDVDLTGISDGNGLKWNGTSWVPGEISAGDTTGYASPTYLQTAIDNLVGSSPASLNTVQEISAALQNSSTSLDNFISFISRSKTVEFTCDGSTRSFAVNHIAGNLDVWVNGILQKPNILDSTDTNGSKSLDIDKTSFPFTFDFDYYSTDNVTIGKNGGNVYNDYSSNSQFPYFYLSSHYGQLRVIPISNNYNNGQQPWTQNNNPSSLIYEQMGKVNLSAYSMTYNVNYWGDDRLTVYPSPAYFHWYDAGGTFHPREPRYVHGYNDTISQAHGNAYHYYYKRTFYSYDYKTIVKTAKTSCSHIFFPDPPSNGSIIKVRVY